MPAVSFVRMSTDPAAELQTMADSLEADVLVYEGDDTADRGLVAVTCQLVRIHPDAPLRAPCIQLVHTAGNDGDAAAEIALRLAAGSGRPLAIVDANSAIGRQLSRRALGLVTAATRAGIVVLTGPSQEPCLTVGPVGAGTAPAVEAHVSVRAEEDREIVPAEQMVRQITIVAPASVEPAAP
jgi:hypothetical protein